MTGLPNPFVRAKDVSFDGHAHYAFIIWDASRSPSAGELVRKLRAAQGLLRPGAYPFYQEVYSGNDNLEAICISDRVLIQKSAQKLYDDYRKKGIRR